MAKYSEWEQLHHRKKKQNNKKKKKMSFKIYQQEEGVDEALSLAPDLENNEHQASSFFPKRTINTRDE